MNERFLELYDVELQHLRHLAGEFARHRPQTGKQLGIDPEGRQLCQDPFVERLLEGFAFLAARSPGSPPFSRRRCSRTRWTRPSPTSTA